MGQLAAIGIVKGKPFEPDERMRRILEDAAAVGNATSRALFFDPRASEGFAYYDELGVVQHAVGRRLHVRDAAAAGHRRRGSSRSPRPASGSCTPGPRSSTRPPGSRPRCACGSPGSGRSTSWPSRTPTATASTARKTYRVTLPPDIPAARFWSFTALRQRDALDARRHRSASRAPGASPTRHRRRPRTPTARRPITFGPERPADSPEGNWIQTTEGKGWFPILRLYSPLEPFFDKTWRPSEIERRSWPSTPEQPRTKGSTMAESTNETPRPRPAREHDRGLGRRVESRRRDAHARSHRRARRGRCPAGLVSAEPRGGSARSGSTPSRSAASSPRSRRSSARPESRPRRATSSTRSRVAIEVAELEEQGAQ